MLHRIIHTLSSSLCYTSLIKDALSSCITREMHKRTDNTIANDRHGLQFARVTFRNHRTTAARDHSFFGPFRAFRVTVARHSVATRQTGRLFLTALFLSVLPSLFGLSTSIPNTQLATMTRPTLHRANPRHFSSASDLSSPPSPNYTTCSEIDPQHLRLRWYCLLPILGSLPLGGCGVTRRCSCGSAQWLCNVRYRCSLWITADNPWQHIINDQCLSLMRLRSFPITPTHSRIYTWFKICFFLGGTWLLH